MSDVSLLAFTVIKPPYPRHPSIRYCHPCLYPARSLTRSARVSVAENNPRKNFGSLSVAGAVSFFRTQDVPDAPEASENSKNENHQHQTAQKAPSRTAPPPACCNTSSRLPGPVQPCSWRSPRQHTILQTLRVVRRSTRSFYR